MKLLIDNEEYIIVDKDIQSSEVTFASYSGYLAFYAQTTEEVLKKYGNKLLGKKLGTVYALTDGVITAIMDKNMDPLKELDNIVGERFIEFGASFTGAFIGGMIAGPVGAVVGAVIGGLNSDDWYNNGEKVINLFYNKLSGKYDNIEFINAKIHGTITKEEFILTELKGDNNFCKKVFPKYARYRQKVTIGSASEYGKTLSSFIMNDSKRNKAEIKINTLKEAKILMDEIINIDTKNKLKKQDTLITTTSDGQEYRVIKKELLSHIAKESNVSVKDLLNHNEWVKNESRY